MFSLYAGTMFGKAFDIPHAIRGETVFASVVLKVVHVCDYMCQYCICI